MLPQELLDEIVELLPRDHPSLKALSCTAQCLRDRSQALLFHYMVLSPTKPPSSYLPLLEMSPHILKYFRRLRIVFTGASFRGHSPACAVHEDTSFGRLIHAVTNVDDIQLMSVDSVSISPEVLLPIISSPRIRIFRLKYALLRNPQSLFDSLSYFPSVSSLHLDIVHAIEKSPSVDYGNSRLFELHLGRISPTISGLLFNDPGSKWLRHLRSLIIDSYSATELSTYSEVIPKLPNLISLTLGRPLGDVGYLQTQQRLAAEIPAFPFQKIRSLRLSLPGFNSALTKWWLGHLTQVTAVSLEYLAIDFLYENEGAASEMQHSMAARKELEIALLRLPRLKSVSMKTVIDSKLR